MSNDEAESWDSDEKTWDKHINEQFVAMHPALYRIDYIVIKATEWILVAAGVLFTFLISYDVVSRYVFGSSSFFVSAGAKFLLLWFFLLGAGLALRQGSHVGFELLVNNLKPGPARIVKLVGQVLSLVFFVEMLWSGLVSLGPAAKQTDPALNLSLLWGFLAIPVGFALLIYHMLVLMALDRRAAASAGRAAS
ncbi:TRAP transporter small permease [Bosea caraganae]|nr:TRAP transporter small permease subunit [Bosea caraganae]